LADDTAATAKQHCRPGAETVAAGSVLDDAINGQDGCATNVRRLFNKAVCFAQF